VLSSRKALNVILSGNKIKKCLDKGTIVINPRDDRNINPGSVDVTLSRKIGFYKGTVFKSETQSPEDVVTLFLSSSAPLDPKNLPEVEYMTIPDSGIVLTPGVCILGATHEIVHTNRYIPVLDGKSSIARMFLQIHVTAGYGETGFDGQYTLEIVPHLPIKVYAGMRIGQIRFHKVSGKVINYQNVGSYTGAKSIGPVGTSKRSLFNEEKLPMILNKIEAGSCILEFDADKDTLAVYDVNYKSINCVHKMLAPGVVVLCDSLTQEIMHFTIFNVGAFDFYNFHEFLNEKDVQECDVIELACVWASEYQMDMNEVDAMLSEAVHSKATFTEDANDTSGEAMGADGSPPQNVKEALAQLAQEVEANEEEAENTYGFVQAFRKLHEANSSLIRPVELSLTTKHTSYPNRMMLFEIHVENQKEIKVFNCDANDEEMCEELAKEVTLYIKSLQKITLAKEANLCATRDRSRSISSTFNFIRKIILLWSAC
jgi:dCTP deaminase